MICYDNRNYLLCTLQKGQIWQVPLDLNFEEGTKIAFTCNGDGHVHLTGYLIPEDEGLDELDDFEEDDLEDEEIPQLVGQKKRKAELLPKGKNDLKQVKKAKVEADEDEDDSDDDDEEIGGLEDDSDDDDDDDDLDEEDDDEEDEDEDDSDEDEEEEEAEETPVKLSKKQKQKQKQQNQQNQQQNQSQQQNKKDKTKMVNGKDAKPEKEQGKQKKNKDDSNKTEDKSEQQQPKKRTVEGGVQVEDLKVGGGAPAKAGKFISVHYVGRLKNGKKFDQTQQGEGFKFRLGKGEVIKGWDVGIVGMKVGGKRRLTIPPNMA